MSFRLNFDLHAATLSATTPAAQAIGTWNLDTHFTGLRNGDSITALTAEASVYGTNDAAITVRLTFNGTGVSDKTYDVNIGALAAAGEKSINESMDAVTQYKTVTVTAWYDSEPATPSTDLRVSLLCEYPAVITGTAGEGLFTITEVISAKRPDSPITYGVYWDDLRAAAEGVVKSITRRELLSANYTDKGDLVPVKMECGTRYAWYLNEPTGSTLDFDSFTTLTLDETTVAEDDVLIESNRLLFLGGGEIVATYPGGWLRDATAEAVIRQAVIEVMHILHARGSAAGFTGVAQGGGQSTLSTDPFSQVRQMLSPYTAALRAPYVAEVT